MVPLVSVSPVTAPVTAPEIQPVQNFPAARILVLVGTNNAWMINTLKEDSPQASQLYIALGAHFAQISKDAQEAAITTALGDDLANAATNAPDGKAVGTRILNEIDNPTAPAATVVAAVPAEYKSPETVYDAHMKTMTSRETTILASLEYTLPVAGSLPRLALNVINLLVNISLASYHGAASMFDRFESDIQGEPKHENGSVKKYHREHAKYLVGTLALHNIANIARALTVMLPIVGQAFAIITDNVLKMRFGYENEVTNANVFRLDDANESWSTVSTRVEAQSVANEVTKHTSVNESVRQIANLEARLEASEAEVARLTPASA